MASKEEIKVSFTTELKNTPEYQIILNIKQLIMNEIATPNINRRVVYNFDRSMSYEERNNIILCGIVEFGFEIYVDEFHAEVFMDKFLN
jgi:serine kinase of HPr protein (carbohydrate metabolism regulator)